MARNRGPKRPPQQKKPPLTHFLCLPLVTPASRSQLERSLSTFRNETTSMAGKGEGQIPSKAIRPVGSLHCTLGVMSLDNDRLSEAAEWLQGKEVQDLLQAVRNKPPAAEDAMPARSSSLSPKVEGASGPLEISMKGLVSMHAAHQTSILYAEPVDETGRLYPFCVALQQLFKDKGFLVEDTRQLKLHATVVNTIYAKGRKSTASRGGQSSNDQSSGHGPSANAPFKLDATAILEKYKDFAWAENVVLDRVAICEMGAKKTFNAEGEEIGAEYSEIASTPLNSASPKS